MDDRAKFANDVCKLIYQKNKGNLDNCIIDVEIFYNYFFEHVRNVYELVQNGIPLFWLYELHKYGSDNFEMSEAEHQEKIVKAANDCVKQYG